MPANLFLHVLNSAKPWPISTQQPCRGGRRRLGCDSRRRGRGPSSPPYTLTLMLENSLFLCVSQRPSRRLPRRCVVIDLGLSPGPQSGSPPLSFSRVGGLAGGVLGFDVPPARIHRGGERGFRPPFDCFPFFFCFGCLIAHSTKIASPTRSLILNPIVNTTFYQLFVPKYV